MRKMKEVRPSLVVFLYVWGNLSTPVMDQAYFIGEIHYKIGERLYIENAD
jgi:hypothetical protein